MCPDWTKTEGKQFNHFYRIAHASSRHHVFFFLVSIFYFLIHQFPQCLLWSVHSRAAAVSANQASRRDNEKHCVSFCFGRQASPLPCHGFPGPRPFSYCLLPYGSQQQHGDKPVRMLFPDLPRHPAGTKCRNNYYPNYVGQLSCLFFLFVHLGCKEGRVLCGAGALMKRSVLPWYFIHKIPSFACVITRYSLETRSHFKYCVIQ